VTCAMRLPLLCRVGNATARGVGCCDRAALRLTLRTNCSLPSGSAPPAACPSSVGLGAAKRPPQQVSDLGRVRTADGIITEGSDSGGYLRVCINGKKHSVHRLVAQAGFIPPPPSEKHEHVNHIDRDPTNNRADNLAWVTPSENIRHSYDTNAERKSSAPKQSKPVLGRRHGSEEEWVEYESGNEAARALGLDSGSVRACCRGERKRAGEYEFKRAPLAEDQHDRPGEVWLDVKVAASAAHHRSAEERWSVPELCGDVSSSDTESEIRA
jgi:hypothetical protein